MTVSAWAVKAALLLALAGAAGPTANAPDIAAEKAAMALPLEEGSLRFAVIGDSGTGDAAQVELARKLEEWRAVFPFELVLMLGDNIYGKDDPRDYRRKFEQPYRPLLEAGVKFYAALGNHDDPKQRFYEKFNMGGERYYSFKGPQGKVRFFALDSNYFDAKQREWLEKQLDASGEDWKICFFHHPLYSSGKKHGPAEELREDPWVIGEHNHDATGDVDGDGWHGTMNYSGFSWPVWSWLRDPASPARPSSGASAGT